MKRNPSEKIIRLLECLIVNEYNKRIKEFPVEKKRLWNFPDVNDLLENRGKNKKRPSG